MPSQEKYNFQIIASNIGPHSNLNQSCDAGENGPIRIGIYSANGGGKSSLSRQFRLLEIDNTKLQLSNKYISLGQTQGRFKFKLFRQDDSSENYEFEISHTVDKISQITKKSGLLFHVFNSDYVRESIEPQNFGQNKSIQGYIMGRSMVDLSKQQKELQKIQEDFGEAKDRINSFILDAKKQLHEFGVRPNTSEYIQISFESIINNNNPTENYSANELKALLTKLKNIPEDLSDVAGHNGELIFDLTQISSIVSDLQEDVSISKLSKEFKIAIMGKENFIRIGIDLLKNSNTNCPFCEQELGEEQAALIDRFISYIEDAETVYIARINSKIQLINSVKSSIENKQKEFLRLESEFNRNKDYFPSFKNQNITLMPDVSFIWDEIISIIKLRTTDVSLIIDTERIDKIREFVTGLTELQESVNSHIKTNNRLVSSINEIKQNTNNEVLELKKRLCRACHIELSKALQRDILSLNELTSKERAKIKEINNIECQTKKLKHNVVDDTFIRLIKFIFNDKYVFDKDTSSLKLQSHSLKTNAHNILSDGEKNVIAFCYYIAETHSIVNKDSDYDSLFFVMDDPISSMDFHYTYSLCRILERLNDYFPYSHKKYLRFILFTHNIEFMSILLRNNVIQKKYVLTNGKIKELKKELVMPYHEHLSDIYKVALRNIEPNHTTPNSMRNVLETIAKFENPNQDLISYVDNNEVLRKCSSLYNMIQDLSHGVIRSQPAIMPDDIIQGCVTIVDFMEIKYKGQIDNIKRTI